MSGGGDQDEKRRKKSERFHKGACGQQECGEGDTDLSVGVSVCESIEPRAIEAEGAIRCVERAGEALKKTNDGCFHGNPPRFYAKTCSL